MNRKDAIEQAKEVLNNKEGNLIENIAELLYVHTMRHGVTAGKTTEKNKTQQKNKNGENQDETNN